MYDHATEGAAPTATGTMSSPDSSALDSDQLFEILSSSRRRMILYYLRKHGGTATMDELADQIASWENETPIDDLSRKERKRVYVSLYQTHLPKLAETDLVEYDVDDGDIRLGDRAGDMDRLLSSEEPPEYSWRRHYLGFLVLGGALMVFAVLSAPWLGGTALVVLSALILFGYLAMAGLEYWEYRKTASEIPPELVPVEE